MSEWRKMALTESQLTALERAKEEMKTPGEDKINYPQAQDTD